jgi:hypothetical protein
MRRIFLASLLFTFLFGNHTISAQEANFRDPQTWLLGYFTPDLFLLEPHESWFSAEFDVYEIDGDAFMELSETDMTDVEVLVVLGTWCPDSRREVPRFMKIMELSGFDQELISLMGTDSYKVAPVDNYDDLNIDRVPTFIFYYKKNEIGRIIEYPLASLERDMVNIFKKIQNN